MDRDKLKSELSSLYHELAGIELAMNFYNLYAGWTANGDDPRTSPDDIYEGRSCLDRTIGLVKQLFLEDAPASDIESQLLELRKKLSENTMAFASYADRFKLYEYFLNRKCGADVVPAGIADDDSVARDILTSVFATDDNSTINENIRLVVAQLPLRMTKSRFFDILDDTFKRYIGSEKSSLDRLKYMISSAAGLIVPTPGIDYFEKEISFFDGLVAGESTAAELEAAGERLKKTVRVLVDTTDLYQGLAETVNLACVCAMNMRFASEHDRAFVLSMKPAVDEAVQGISRGECTDMSEEARSCFVSVEGKLEQLVMSCSKLDASFLDKFSGDSDDDTQRLKRSHLLMSTSLFADLDEEETGELSDPVYEESVYDEIKAKFELVLTSSSKLMNRARMAAALAELPVFFGSRTEFMNYVRDSLSGCRDRFEKMVSVRLILDSIGK